MQVKAIACELPSTLGLALLRLSTADIVREAQRCGMVATISDKTVWRWLHDIPAGIGPGSAAAVFMEVEDTLCYHSI